MADPAVSPPTLRGHRSFVAYWCARTATNAAYQMQAVAVGWQIYELTGSAFDLGLVGLVQFFPVVVLGLLIGQIADRYDRRVVVGICQIVKALAAAAFAIGTLGGFLTRDVMLAILFVSGTARAFETPTMHTLVPGIVPPELLQRAIASSGSAGQTAIICGPALGGLLYVFGASTVYLTCTAVFVLASILVSRIQMQSTPPDKKPVTVEAVFAGFRYIRHNKVVLGAISLDLFAMLLGGVTALLPIYAKDVLDDWPLGPGPAALGSGDRRIGGLDLARAPSDPGARRPCAVRLDRRVRGGGRGVRVFDLDRALDPGARGLWGGRRGQRRDPPFAGADAHAARDARPRAGGELHVHRHVWARSANSARARWRRCLAHSRRCWSEGSARSPWRCSG